MFAFLRRTFRRRDRFDYRSSDVPESHYHIRAPPKTKKSFRGMILLLDEATVSIDIPKKALGIYLENEISKYIELPYAESSYFGLQYTDHNNIRHWLDPSKQIRKQVDVGPPYTMHFRVRFYPSDPMLLKDELTRYQVFLQVKQDMLSKFRLGGTNLTTAAEMAALSLQSELGDYIEEEHTPFLISKFRFLPDERQTEDFELDVLDNYKTCSGKLPAKAEADFLKKACFLERYGVDFHDVMSQQKPDNAYKFGLTPTGIMVYEDSTTAPVQKRGSSSSRKSVKSRDVNPIIGMDNMAKIGHFPWNRIKRLDFRKKMIHLDVADLQPDGTEKTFNFKFYTHSKRHTKHLWKSAIAHHQFFRLAKNPNAQQDMKNQGSKFLRTKSNYSFKGRTEKQIKNNENFSRTDTRRSEFTRRASKRYKGRASFSLGTGVSRRVDISQANNSWMTTPNNNTTRGSTSPEGGYSSKSTQPAQSRNPSQDVIRSPSRGSLKEAFKIAI